MPLAPSTAFGAIAERLADREETEFQRGLRRFGHADHAHCLFLVLFILVVRIAMHKDAFESFVFAVALAVGLTPEFLPMITSVTLGAAPSGWHGTMSSSSTCLPFKISAPSMCFCSDKTGTLTTGEMVLDSSVDYLQAAPPIVHWHLAYVNSKFEIGHPQSPRSRNPQDGTAGRRCLREM